MTQPQLLTDAQVFGDAQPSQPKLLTDAEVFGGLPAAAPATPSISALGRFGNRAPAAPAAPENNPIAARFGLPDRALPVIDPTTNNPVFGAGEAALSAALTVPRMAAAGVAGLEQAGINKLPTGIADAMGLTQEPAADAVKRVGSLFYEPHTPSGKAIAAGLAMPFEALHKYVAEPAGEAFASPEAAAILQGLPIVGPALAELPGPERATAISTAVDFAPFLLPGGKRGERPAETAAGVAAETAPRRTIRQRIADAIDPDRRDAAREAMTDPLTGLANRRAWDRALPSAEKDPDTAVAVFDVRGLKAANDLVGAEKGDALIQKAAGAVRQASQEITGNAERVFRQGGDELGWIGPKDVAGQVRERAIELMGDESIQGYPVGLRGAIGDTAAEADAGVRAAKAAEEGPKYRTANGVEGADHGAPAATGGVGPEAAVAEAMHGTRPEPSPEFRDAVDKLMKDGAGEVPSAMVNAEIGPIDLVWGRAGSPERNYEDGYGLAHILAKHPEIDPYALEDIVARAKVTGRRGNTVELETPDHRSIVKLDWEGRKKKWLLTTFEKNPAAPGERIGVAGSAEPGPLPGQVAESKGATEGALSDESIANPPESGGAQRMAAIPERQNMQAGANYVGLHAENAIPEVAEAKPGKPITRQDVLRPFLKALGVRLYEGRVKGKGTLGFYLPKKEAVRIKKKGDLEVAAHELAHLIDDRVPEIGQSWRPDQFKAEADKKLARQRRRELKGVSYDEKNTKEGFAEFVRLWMTQPEEAAKRAPAFNDWFNDFIERSEYGPALKQARESMQDWYHQTDLQRAKSKIGVTKPINAALDGIFDRFRQSVADDLHGVYRMERELKGTVEHGGQYETARLTRASYTVAERAFLDGAPKKLPDGTTTFEGKGLQQILDPVAGELDNFLLYAIGRSSHELMEQGRENLFTRTEIRAMRALETPEFRKAFDEYQAWNKAVVDFAQAHGIINPATRALWQRAQYLPMYRVDETLGGRRAKGIEGNWNGIHRLMGGTGNVKDVLGNIMQNATRLIVDSIKNEARVSIADLADQQRGGGRFMVKISRDTKPIGVDKEQIHEFVYQMLGIPRHGKLPPEVMETVAVLEHQFAQQPGFIQFWMHGQAPKGDNVVAVMRGGKPDFYEVADPLLYRAISSLSRPARHWLVTALSYPKRIGQASVTLTVDFMVRNIVRDTLMAGIMSKNGFRPVLDSLSGMKSRVLHDDAYKEAIANGGGLSAMMRDEKAFRKHLDRFYTKKGFNAKWVLDAPDKLVYALETIAEAFEASTRYGEYKRARAKGASPKEAAYQMREVSTDFAMRGDSQVLGFLYDTVMFLKPMVNSMDRLYRGVAHDEQRFRIAAKVAILATASAALYLYNRHIQDYQDLPDWDKDTYWHIFVPDGQGGYYHFRIPKLWEVGALSSLAERTTEHLIEKNPDHPLWLDTARILGNLFYVNGIPQALAPLYEIATNKNSFTGAPIESESAQSLQPWARSNAYTPETLVELGKLERNLPRAMQVSPDKMNALLRGYFNTWAAYALSLSDAALFDTKPSLRVDQYPVIKSFYEASPLRHTKYENQFYNMLKEATEARRTFTAMAKERQNEIAGELANSPEQAVYTSLNAANRQLQVIRRAMEGVRDDPNLSPDEKRTQLDKLTRERNELMQAAVDGAKQTEASIQ